MYLSKIRVTLRKSILDPQGKAVEHAIGSLGLLGVGEVRMGKYIELKVDSRNETAARNTTEEVCKKLLANPVMEDYHFEIEKLP
ncbi:MAG: phosphoribosylformylglycinamidine synthase subunit PurS [Ignavibacteriae bacterium]|nr:phosphoribosylformylglycinamidine synthase subunit PurS [Ignavibacteriota bacterium]